MSHNLVQRGIKFSIPDEIISIFLGEGGVKCLTDLPHLGLLNGDRLFEGYLLDKNMTAFVDEGRWLADAR